MEPIMFLLLLSISVIGIFVILGLSHFKFENNVGHTNVGNHNFNSFMTKVKNNSLKITKSSFKPIIKL
jgi:uncharacterized membrane protein YkgB